jgi:hypothetical protein
MNISPIIEKINHYKNGIINLAIAEWNLIENGEVDESIQEFRKHQCTSCPLFDKVNKKCNNAYLSNGKSIISIDRLFNGELPKIEVDGEIRKTTYNNELYTKGCGCILWTDEEPKKIKYYFSDELLEKNDGTAPCPLNKWTKKEYERYVVRKNSKNSKS